jgi:hypothetical protein
VLFSFITLMSCPFVARSRLHRIQALTQEHDLRFDA